ncbi:hypothetical protein J4217_02585 [Candidatus Pacearchaeota archaeon]|nr:hypothetical protein [Candidatus Pacearchaeota archaeon]
MARRDRRDDILGLIMVELSKEQIVSLFHSLESHIKFLCHDDILLNEDKVETLVNFVPRKPLTSALKQIRPDLSLEINMIFKMNQD